MSRNIGYSLDDLIFSDRKSESKVEDTVFITYATDDQGSGSQITDMGVSTEEELSVIESPRKSTTNNISIRESEGIERITDMGVPNEQEPSDFEGSSSKSVRIQPQDVQMTNFTSRGISHVPPSQEDETDNQSISCVNITSGSEVDVKDEGLWAKEVGDTPGEQHETPGDDPSQAETPGGDEPSQMSSQEEFNKTLKGSKNFCRYGSCMFWYFLLVLCCICFFLVPRHLEICLRFSFDNDDIAEKLLGDEGQFELEVKNTNFLPVNIFDLDIIAYSDDSQDAVMNVVQKPDYFINPKTSSFINGTYVFAQNASAFVTNANAYCCSQGLRTELEFNLRFSFKGCLFSFMCMSEVVSEVTFFSDCPGHDEWGCTGFDLLS